VPMLPLFADTPPGVDYSQTITDAIGVVDSTAFVGPVNYAYTLTDSIGVSDSIATRLASERWLAQPRSLQLGHSAKAPARRWPRLPRSPLPVSLIAEATAFWPV
jgi:hypothetical protein